MKRALCIVLTAILLLLLLPAMASGEETSGSSKRDILVYARITDDSKGGTKSPQTEPGTKTDPGAQTDPGTKTDSGSSGGQSKTEDPVYTVELKWGNMTFDYARNSAEPWSIPEGKDENGLAVNEIQVKNCSNAAVLYRTTFSPADAKYPLTGVLTAKKWNDEAAPCQYEYAYLPNPDEGDNKIFKRHIDHVFLSVSGTLPSSLSPGVVQVGKVTVEIIPESEG